ncbi:MAG TPA: NAD(P)H-binding protein [Lacibacter sp.]|nr:NAD(P)H-binding protein [Lacibacter sp.]HMO89636.1 NAD(P)H-binding protein [Lacibacter sp.]HMP86630.1 NAD(P)H-binding protein [Lacibacter sp.]
MRITVFGATGLVGRQVCREALWRGHTVVAFGRNTQLLEAQSRLETVKGALFDPADVARALRGADAVISVVGGAIDGADRTRSLGMKIIVQEMQKTGVRRIVALGGLGILNAPEGGLLLDADEYPDEYRAVGEEHRKAYQHLLESPLDWTFVCSPDIEEGDPTGSYRTSSDVPPEPNSFRIFSGDLAQFILRETEDPTYVRKRAGICN